MYSAEPPPRAFRHEDLQQKVDREPWRDVEMGYRGPIEVESYTVMYGGDGPTIGHVAARLPNGHRAWGNTQDPAVLSEMTREEFCGREGRLDGNGNALFG